MAKHGLLNQIGDIFFSLLESSPFAKLLDLCAQSKSLLGIRRVHARIARSQFGSETFILNKLVDAYGKCGSLGDALKVFEKIPDKNVFSWNSILTALTKLGCLYEAEGVFGVMPERDQCSWNAMVSGYAQHERFREALCCFLRMHGQDFILNEYSFGSGLSACAGLKDLCTGTQIHGLISKTRHQRDVYMGSALVDMYAKCASVSFAQSVFNEMNEKNRVSWNSLISCYEQNGPVGEALELFVQMMNSGIEPDEVTLASVVSACASLARIKEGQQIHARVMKSCKLRDDIILSNALVDMYAKCRRVHVARCIFDQMPVTTVVSETSMLSGYAKAESVKAARVMFMKMAEKNIVSWNALIAGYTQTGENEEALGLYRLLKRGGSLFPSHYTFGNLLNACANLADLKLGRQSHAHVLKHGFWFISGEDSDIFVGNALMDMYMKCGSVEDGSLVFVNMAEKDWVSWNAMIVGYAQNGYGTEALELFRDMLAAGEKPDHVTMIGVLCACSHAGLVQDGRYYFQAMSREHNLVPMKDHYACMVDLLGRAGCLSEAKDLINMMPMQPDAVVWGSLLGACKTHRNIALGEYVAEKLLEIDPNNSGPYVLLSNMYAELGRWRDVVRTRKLMRKQGVVKQPGCSWIEIGGHMNVFMVKDKKHPQRKEIYLLLKILITQMKRAGYVPKFSEFETYEEEDGSEIVSSSHMNCPAITAVG